MQTVSSPPESEQTSRFPSRLTLIALVVGGLMALLVVSLVALRTSRSGVLPNTTLAGGDVGGLTQDELRARVDDLAETRADDTITVTLGAQERISTNAEAGYTLDREATVDAVWSRGRQANLPRAVADQVRATFGTIAVTPVEDVDTATLDAWAGETAEALSRPPREGTVRFDGATVRRRDPRQGQRPTQDSLTDGARAAFAEPGDDTVAADAEPIATSTTTADIDALERTARVLVSAPVRLNRDDASLRLSPATIGGLYKVRRTTEGDDVELSLRLVGERLREVLDDETRARFETAARNATVVLTGNGPRVRNGSRGFKVDMQAVRAQVDELARTRERSERTAEIAGKGVAPDLTTKEARQLRITRRVSSFTTEHACCQGRVTNIHRFADLMDGALILPGETFSLNGHVGPRTRAKGFVGGGAIQQGEYVDEVGGGVSQFATTFFNAAWFGGYDIVEYKAHSYYISRYPAGRESTINWPTVDVKIRNNSPYGLLVDTSYTSTSITVTFWGKKWADVDTRTGSRTNYTNPPTEVKTNPDLPKGSKQVIQSGSQGFDITVVRHVNYREGGSDTEEYFTRYLPEPRIIERGA